MVYGPTQSNPVGGDHGDLIAALAAFLMPRIYLELGVAEGETLRKVIAATRSFDCMCIGVDRTITDRALMSSAGGSVVETDTVEYLRQSPGESVEMIFLDSSHEYEATLRELAEIERVLRPNGVLAMHDTYPPNEGQERQGYCGDVWRASTYVRSCETSNSWECMTLAAEYGITLARRKGRDHLLWKA